MGKIRFRLKRQLIVLIAFILITFLFFSANAAPLVFEPVTRTLPDGTVIKMFVSGDEFFNYLHDANGFPVGTGDDGYYYYLIQNIDNFVLTTYRVGAVDPNIIPGIKTVSIPSYVSAKREAYQKQMDELSAINGVKSINKSSGVFNNLVIYIRFKNEPEFSVTRSAYDTRLNSLTGSSLRVYYREVSYNKLDMYSYSFPGGATSNIYYTDTYTRNYYQDYASTNPTGYQNETERTSREHALLANAISWATSNYNLPDVNFDLNQDGYFDNICFIIKGSADGWNELLWPHRWALFSQIVKIGNLRVSGYTFQLENVTVTTLSHEMFHALGAPDLYHYNDSEYPVGPWDIMANGGCHMGSWMKYKYGGWISKLPEVKESGTYVLKPLDQEKNNCYKIKSPYREDQFFVVEFRKKEGNYESLLPASGLIVQRIDTRYTGNSTGPPDEIYIFRKNGGLGLPGDINSAALSDLYGRKSFSDDTNPYAFFQDGTKTGINISNVISMGDSMAFSVNIDSPVDLTLTPVEDTRMTVSWKCVSGKNFLVAASTTPETLTPRAGVTYNQGDTIRKHGVIVQNAPDKTLLHSGLESDQDYYYTVWTVVSTTPLKYSVPVSANKRTGIYSISALPYEEKFDNISSELPRGWKAYTGTEGWQLYTTQPFSAPNSVVLKNTAQISDDWLFTPGFELNTSKKYMITFRYRNKVNSVKESLYLRGGTARYNNGLALLNLFSSTDFDFKDYALFKSVFETAGSGTFYFGYRTGDTKQGVIIDDFKFEEVPINTTQHSEPEEFYPNPTTGSIIVPATGNTGISIFRTDGTKMYDMEIESMQQIDLSFLGKGVFLIRFTTSEKSITRKIIIL
jgi:M6 family metalloprotease-like protein